MEQPVGRRKFPARDVMKVQSEIDKLKKQGLPDIRGFTKGEAQTVKRYLLRRDARTWKQITRGGTLGYSLFLHERHEIELLMARGIDLDDDEAVGRAYEEVHAAALLLEHRWLRHLAQTLGYDSFSIATLVACNPTVNAEQRRFDVELLSEHYRLQPNEQEKQQVNQFFQELMQTWQTSDLDS